MNLRTRLTVLVALCVAGAVVVASLVAYVATKNRLVGAVDETLEGRAQFVGERTFTFPVGGPVGGRQGNGAGQAEPPRPGIPSIDVFQVVDSQGATLFAPDDQDVVLPVSDRDLAVATGDRAAYLHNVSVGGEEYRVYTARGQQGEAILVARSLAEVNDTLAGLRNILIAVSVSGVAAATVLGLVVSQRSLRPISRLTLAAEHVAATQDLSHTIDAPGSDEIGRLAGSFNTMLRALDESREQQRRLVADASHELRTPLTSLRTNIEVLATDREIDAEKRAILNDAMTEVNELTKIVTELVDLAMDPRADERVQADVRLDEIAAAVVERARRRSGLRMELESEPTLVVGNAELLERAVGNLIDNACKWSPPDQPVRVLVRDGRVVVRDGGAGITAEDLPHVFDRFYRSNEARSKPGSGLGLAIVKQVAEAHGGKAFVESVPGRGTTAGFSLPTIPLGAT